MADLYQTGVKMEESYKGKLLIATPVLDTDVVFHHSVVYIYEQRPNGEHVGVILNKPSEFRCTSLGALKGIDFDPMLEDKVIHKGGPVSDTSILLLHTSEWTSTNTMTATEQVCMTSDALMLEKLAMGNEPDGWRMFAGMSVWQRGQLQDEINRGGWLQVATPSNHAIFDYADEAQYVKGIDLAASQTFADYLQEKLL